MVTGRDGVVAARPVDFESLVGSWRTTFMAAEGALAAGRHDLTPTELRSRRQRLGDERAATASLLETLARERHARSFLVRLVASPWEAKRLLGVPGDAVACIFNVDGVLVASAAIHAQAWKQTLDEFVARRVERTHEPIASFSTDVDYPEYIHGRARSEAVQAFLASRGLALPEGASTDTPTTETVNGIANAKAQALLDLVSRREVEAFEGARLFLELVHDARMASAVVSGSTNAHVLLDHARLGALIDDCVDGTTMRTEALRRKPAPDALLAACRHLGVAPERAVVFETTADGVAAGRAAHFELVVRIDPAGAGRELETRGADRVSASLEAVLERQLATG